MKLNPTPVVLLVHPTFVLHSYIPSSGPFAPILPVRGRKRDSIEELLARVKVKGYQMGRYKEENEVRDRHKYVGEAEEDRNAALDRHVL